MTSSYYKGTQGCLVVYDVTDMESFEKVSRHVDTVLQVDHTLGAGVPK